MQTLLSTWLTSQGASPLIAATLAYAIILGGVLLAALIGWWAAKHLMLPLIEGQVRRTHAEWDDLLVEKGFFNRLANLLPLLILVFGVDVLLPATDAAAVLFRRLTLALFVLACLRLLESLLAAAGELIAKRPGTHGKPIKSYIQGITILAYILGAIFLLSILTGKSPWGLLSIFGGLTAILVLVFKDTILGFLAGIQISAHDMVRIGDWIEMPKYGADGDVVDVSIHTVKVRNWDKTIVTIPTYTLVSESFKNWRGMREAGGRRIKRAIYLDMNTIRFLTPEDLERLKKIDLIRDYIERRQKEIEAYNATHVVTKDHPVNGRKQTNVGVFRAYCVAYLRQHPQIRQDMTFLVRHLAPTPQGLPLEIYVFCRDIAWANYESIQADIFDHLLAALPHFDLTAFQYPSGNDLKHLRHLPHPPKE